MCALCILCFVSEISDSLTKHFPLKMLAVAKIMDGA
jgi:hypothetical protein